MSGNGGRSECPSWGVDEDKVMWHYTVQSGAEVVDVLWHIFGDRSSRLRRRGSYGDFQGENLQQNVEVCLVLVLY